MNALKPQWERLTARYAALSRRERGLTAAALVLGPLFAANTLFLEPELNRGKALRGAVAQQRQELSVLDAQSAGLQAGVGQDPDAIRKAELASLRRVLAVTTKRLNQLPDSLLPPQEMKGFLEKVLARNPALRLVSLKTLPPESMSQPLPAPTDKTGEKPVEKPLEKLVEKAGTVLPAADRSFDIYRHGIELRLEGRYPDLHAYLAQLEREQKKLLWGELQFSVVEYPTASLTLVVYTLSPDKAWLTL